MKLKFIDDEDRGHRPFDKLVRDEDSVHTLIGSKGRARFAKYCKINGNSEVYIPIQSERVDEGEEC